MGKIILSAFADEHSESFESQLKFLSESDIGFIEIRGVDGKNISELNCDEVKNCADTLQKYGIKVSSIGSPLGKISIDGDIECHMEKAKRVFETANTLSCTNCRVFSFYIPEGKTPDECYEKVTEAVSRMLDIADSHGITLCHENEHGIYGESPERAKKLIDTFNGRLKCVFDMGNFVLDGYKPYPDAYSVLRNDIKYFHIKDALYEGAIVPAGCGNASIKEILDDYSKHYENDFTVSIEPHLQTFEGFNALTDRTFDNPYKFETREKAFEEAIRYFRGLWK